jgi:hypothetical protein
VPSNRHDVHTKFRQNRQISSKSASGEARKTDFHKSFPFSGRKLILNFNLYRTADTPHFNYKCQPIAVFVQWANRGLF